MDWVVLSVFFSVFISLNLTSYWLSIRFWKPIFSHFEQVSTILITTILTLNILFSVFLISLILVIFDLTINSAWAILNIILMSLLAYGDCVKGRIPVWFPCASFVIGIVFGVFREQLVSCLLGGIINLGIGVMIYLGGRGYARIKRKSYTQKPYFGFGDVYGAGVLGFLLGFPGGLAALIFSLILLVLFAILESVIFKTKLLQIRMRVGLFYYFSALAMIFIGLTGSAL